MAKQKPRDLNDYIEPLDINGLQGRMLRIPAINKRRKREILLLYGSHSSLERMFALAEEFNKYGGVTIPDLPGFGGMDSFYNIGIAPNVDAMADYLAAFVKMRYKNRRFTVVGMSYGFVLATRLLQKYPDIAKKVDLVVSIAGLVHKDDFNIPRSNFLIMRYGTWLFSRRLPCFIASQVIKKPIISATYHLLARRHSKMKDATLEVRKKRIDFEVLLWRINHLRTYFHTAHSMFTLDLCGKGRVQLPVSHVAISNDQFFDNYRVEQHLGIIYDQVDVINVKLHAHMPTIVATAKEVAPFIPRRLRQLLASA